MEKFDLEGRDHIALCNLLQLTGLCSSGGTAKFFIADGQVTVDGHVESRKRCKIRSEQIVEFEGKQIKIR